MSKKRTKVPKTTARTRLTVALDDELRKRLGAYAGWRGLDEGKVVAEALTTLMRGFYVGSRGATIAETDSEASDVDGEPGATILKVA